MHRLTDYLLFLFGACIPFVVVGPMISSGLWLSPSILIGVLLVATTVLVRGLTVRFVLLAAMLFVFGLTSAGRHPPGTYLFSLLGLFAVMAPMCIQSISWKQVKWTKLGFVLGLCVTLVTVWAEVLSQVFSQDYIYNYISNLFGGVDSRMNPHNNFILYQRPQAAFSEPASLAIYLNASLVILDLVGTRFARFLRPITYITIISVGSMVGYVLLLAYGLMRFYKLYIDSEFRAFVSQIAITFLLLTFGAVTIFLTRSTAIFGIIEKIADRINKTVEILGSGDLVGSEASRVNVFPVLMDYWQMEGFTGFLFGTGYGNTSDWLVANYSHLGGYASVGRGDFDNILVGVFLSTGMIGISLYLLFTALCLSRVGKRDFLPIFITFILFNFSTGFLIAYPIWHLMALIVFLGGFHRLRSIYYSPLKSASD